MKVRYSAVIIAIFNGRTMYVGSKAINRLIPHFLTNFSVSVERLALKIVLAIAVTLR